MFPPHRNDLLKHACEQERRSRAQQRIVHDKRLVQPPRPDIEFAHQLATTEDDGEVGESGDQDGRAGAEGRMAWLPGEEGGGAIEEGVADR